MSSRRQQSKPVHSPERQPPRMRSRLERAVAPVMVLSMFVACCTLLADTDLHWHLKTGEWILEHGQVPYVDLYTFTNGDRPWVDLHWGFQIVMAIVHAVGGTAGVVLTKATCYATVIGIGWYAAGRDLPAWLKWLPWLLALVTISGRGFERPEMVSLVFLATWLWLLERIDERPSLAWWLPVVQLLWVNMHALFVLGLIVGICWATDAVVRSALGPKWGLSPLQTKLTVRQGGYVTAGCFLAALVNPYFEEGALFPLVLYRKFNVEQEYYSSRIGEFNQPIVLFQQAGIFNVYFAAEVALWCVAAASIVGLLVTRRRWSLYRVLMFAAFSHLAWEAVRNTSIFSLVAAVVTCANLQDWWTTRRESAVLFTKVENGFHAAIIGALALFMGLVVTNIWHDFAGERNKFGFGEREAWFAHDAAKFAGQPGFPEHAYAAHFGVASMYLYYNGPQRKEFMDGRLEVCSQQTFELYEQIKASMAMASRDWEPWVRDNQGRLPVVLLDSRFSRNAIQGLMNLPNWRLVFADGSCAVFLETTQADKLGLDRADYTPLLQPPGEHVHW